MSEFIAHVRQDKDGRWTRHDLLEHLQASAVLAKDFSRSFDNTGWVELAALWHDLGKFLPSWQAYLKRSSGYDPDAHIEDGGSRPNHSTVGSVLSFNQANNAPSVFLKAKILAYLIAGHHAGLPDWVPEPTGGDLQNRLFDTLHNRLKTDELNELRAVLEGCGLQELISKPLPRGCPVVVGDQEHRHLWLRMLFSCLVDADFLDTEKFMDLLANAQRSEYPGLEELFSRFNFYMAAKVNGSDKTLLNEARNNILEASLLKGESAPGFFSLAVPTGGGKTLASVGFALRHALKYKKERIIIAIPYTSIIEQTAAVYREVFGEGVVLEHHSNLDPETETRQSRLASENWDAPLIVTTNVQLFESLLASRTSSCRKLHNIANSVIILDEAQMLPSEYLRPILSLLRGLVKYFGVTVVFCTATQPALTGRIGSGEGVFEGISSCVDIVGAVSHLEVFQRYRIEWPDMSKKKSWPELAGELARFEQVLCVVNTRKDCRDLHRLMPDGTVHLSANMCGEHRSGVIACIKAKLSAGEKVRVISTQLVEAGVDIDFPVVYRALAGIDSVVQSAGRCNREGRLNLEGGLGKVIVFIPPELSPAGLLRKGEDVTREIIAQNPEPALGAELYLSYFRSFYRSVNGFDKPKFFDRMVRDSNDLSFQFRTFAQEVRLVDDRGQRSIIVYYKGRRGSSVELIDQLRRNGPEAWLLRKLQRFIVNIPLYEVDKLEKEGHIENVHGYYVQKSTGLYNNRYGLLTDLSLWPTDGFMV